MDIITYQDKDGFEEMANTENKAENNIVEPENDLPQQQAQKIDIPVQVQTTPQNSSMSKISIPLDPLISISTIISQKTRQPINDVGPNKSIRTHVKGKSALQNEILADLSSEFKSEPESAGSIPINELSSVISKNIEYSVPGKMLTSSINKNLNRTMPAGFNRSKVIKYLQDEYPLEINTINGILIFSTHYGFSPEKRHDSEKSAKKWLDDAVSAYASYSKLKIAKYDKNAQMTTFNSSKMIAVDHAEVERIKKLFSGQQRLYKQYFASDAHPNSIAKNDSADDVDIQTLLSEHGSRYIEGIRSKFDQNMIRFYDS